MFSSSNHNLRYACYFFIHHLMANCNGKLRKVKSILEGLNLHWVETEHNCDGLQTEGVKAVITSFAVVKLHLNLRIQLVLSFKVTYIHQLLQG